MNLFLAAAGLAVLAGSAALMARYFGLLNIARRPQLLSCLWLFHVLMHVLPAYILLFDPERAAAAEFFFATILAAALMPLGGVAANQVLPASQGRIAAYFGSGLEYGPHYRNGWRIFLFGLAAVAAVVAVTYISANPSFPLRAILFSLADTPELNLMRREARGNLIQGVALWTLMPMLFLGGALCLRYDRSLLLRLACLAFMAMTVVYNAYAGRKTPVALLFLLWFIMLHVIDTGRPRKDESRRTLRRRRAAMAMIAALAISYPVVIFEFKAFGQSRTVAEVLWEGVVQRVLMKPAENTYVAFEAFPHPLPFTELADTDFGASLGDAKPVDVSSTIAVYKGMAADVNAPPSTIGRFYLEWGWPALVLGVLFEAVFFQLLQNLFFRLNARKTPLNIVFLTFAIWAAFRSSMGYFQAVLLSECFVPVALLCAAGWFTVRYVRIVPPAPAAAGRFKPC